MKKKVILHILSIVFLFSSSTVIFSNKSKYALELRKLKKKPSYKFLFAKDKNQALQVIRRDMKICKSLTAFQRFVRRLFIKSDSIVVTKKNMPELFSYVESLCKKANLEQPVIFVQRKKIGILNAFAQKLLMSSGGFLLTQDLLLKCTEKELEAVIAHEIGHIKHNHVNKGLFVLLVKMGIINVFYYRFSKVNKKYAKMYYDKEEYFFAKNKIKSASLLFYASCLVGYFLPALLIGKRFECQADEFACKMGKSKGIIEFFERMVEKEELEDKEFIFIKELIEQKKERLSRDYSKLKWAYYFAKFNHSINKAFKWLYHNTRLGAHPSNKERIKKAQEYFDKQQAS
jgi:Zn-dependent protease with chaperone function